MAELAAERALAGLGLPLAVGGARLAALPEVRRRRVTPFAGSDAPGPVGRALDVAGGRVVWAGLGQWLVEGDAAVPVAGAAVVEEGDAWAGLWLEGPSTREVLARLVPLDLDPRQAPAGTAARSLLRHVTLLLVVREVGVELLVPRSYARTAVEELGRAMRGVAARGAIMVNAGAPL